MAFPDEDLGILVETAFGADLTTDPDTWVFTDLSDRVLRTPVTVTQGTAVGASSAQTPTATISLRNDDGALTPKRPTSPWWPDVATGTPMRIGVSSSTYLTDTFSRTTTTGWGTSTSGANWTTVPSTDFATTGGVGTMRFTAVNTSRTATTSITAQDVEVLFDAATSVVTTGVAVTVGPALRDTGTAFVWATVEFLAAGAIQVKVWTYVSGVYTAVGQAIVAGLTYTPGMVVRCLVRVTGPQVQVKAWAAAGVKPLPWALTVTQTAVAGAGAISVYGGVFVGNTNTYPLTVSIDNISVRRAPAWRIEGYISNIQPTFLPSGDTTWSDATVTVSGVGSRLETSAAPAYSPMRRSIQLASTPPWAYWPLEDADGSQYGSPAFPGHPKMLVEGPAVFAFAAGVPQEQYLSRYGSNPMVSVAAGARLSAAVPAASTSTQWEVALIMQVYAPDVPGAPDIRVIQWSTPAGTPGRWALVALGAGGYQVVAYDDDAGTSTVVCATGAGTYTAQATYEVEAKQNGPNIDVTLQINSASLYAGSVAGTSARVTQVVANPDKVNTTASVTPNGLRYVVGHIRVIDNILAPGVPYYYDTDQGIYVHADTAWYLETAHRRVARLCAEERIPCTLVATPTVSGSTRLNAQQPGSFTQLVTAAADTESGGLLYEAAFGYEYLPRSARYNQGPVLVIDLETYARSGDTAQGDVLVSELDPRTPTVWTVQRTNGATGTYAADASTLKRRGTIAAEATLDVLRDADTDLHAAWRVHLSVDGRDAVYPSLPIDLAANPGLIDGWLLCRPGSRIHRTNRPDIAGYGVVDQVLDGYTETFGPRMWQVTANTTPGVVWDVAEPGDPVLGRLDTDGSQLTTGISATAMSWQVTVTGGPRWSTTVGDYPVDVEVGGERMTLTAVSGASSPQTFTVVRAVNGVVKSHSAGDPVRLWSTPMIAL